MERQAYSTKEVAAILGVSKGLVALEVKRGNLHVKKFGRRVLILATELEAYLNKLPAVKPKEANHVGL